MKSIINEQKIAGELPFPKLMISANGHLIILATKQITLEKFAGVVVRGEVITNLNDYTVGEYEEFWRSDRFKDFHGSVTLSN